MRLGGRLAGWAGGEICEEPIYLSRADLLDDNVMLGGWDKYKNRLGPFGCYLLMLPD